MAPEIVEELNKAVENKADEVIRQTLTPEQIAAQIIKEATEPQLVEISGTASQKLTTVAKYIMKDQYDFDGGWEKMQDSMRSKAMEILIDARHKQITDYLKAKKMAAKDELFRTLRARGISPAEADKIAYGS